MFDLPQLLCDATEDRPCGCQPRLAEDALVVDGTDCAAGPALATNPDCRATVVGALESERMGEIRCLDAGRERVYAGAGPAVFEAAGHFARAVRGREPRIARRAARDPLAAAREVAGRTGRVAAVAAEVGFDSIAAEKSDYGALLSPLVGPAFTAWRLEPRPPAGGRLLDTRSLDTGATVRRYDRPDRTTHCYHLDPAERRFDAAATGALAAAHEYLADAPPGSGETDPQEAVRAVTDPDAPRPAITQALRKHLRECGLLADLFADPRVSDVYVTAPAERNPVRVRVDGETLDTNVTVTADGVAALASRFRRESGRGFSRAQPTLAAATTVGDRRVRVAGVTEPVSEGQAFAFRAHDRDAWTLPALLATDTLSAGAAGLLSVCVERGGATLLAGPRGSGKTTTLGALLWEIPADVRTVLIEDAPELPVETLQADGRDVQALRAETDGPLEPAAALRSALRLGDGALVVGEVRGEEAGVLYEAMRVGANSEAVLGTIHGDGGEDVLERVVSDLGVPASSFATTDLVVTLEIAGTGAGRTRRVRAIEEVVPGDPVAFDALYERTGEGLVATGRLRRGNSRLVADLSPPAASYEDTLAAVEERGDWLAGLATTGRTDHETLTAAQARRDR